MSEIYSPEHCPNVVPGLVVIAVIAIILIFLGA